MTEDPFGPIEKLPTPVGDPEIVLNLWVFADVYGDVFRIAGKAYAAEGSDDEKYALLRSLARCDFLTAESRPVPHNFGFVGSGGKKVSGVAHASDIHFPPAHKALFLELIEKLEREVPVQFRQKNGEVETFRLTRSERPLTVTTIILESGGQFFPLESGNPDDESE
jgi:hypothetical protein